jgi:hypothetical protein
MRLGEKSNSSGLASAAEDMLSWIEMGSALPQAIWNWKHGIE